MVIKVVVKEHYANASTKKIKRVAKNIVDEKRHLEEENAPKN